MATVLLPRSLLALFPGVGRRHEVAGGSVAAVIDTLDQAVPGLRDRLVESGPRLRPHINVFVDGSPANLTSEVAADSVIHVIPAVSGGAGAPGRRVPRAGAQTAAPPKEAAATPASAGARAHRDQGLSLSPRIRLVPTNRN